MSQPSVYLNGKIVPAEQAWLSIHDAGFLHGASAFTTMRAHNGVVFRLASHLARLLETVEAMGLKTSADAIGLAGATRELLAANELREAQLRVTLSPGSVRGEAAPTTLITAAPLGEHPKAWYEQGITVVISPFKQSSADPACGHKTGCYFPRVLARQNAAERGAEEALWYTLDNRLAEACFSNVFLVLEGAVRTPPLATPVLPGIVRQAVIELCGQLGIPCDPQGNLTVREMLAAQEIFVTNSLSGIRPVAKVELHSVGEGKPGPITKKLMGAYQDLLDRECV